MLDACGVAFIAIGLEALEREGLTKTSVGNIALGLVVGMTGLFWGRLSKRLPDRFVASGIAFATDFKAWLFVALCLGFYFSLSTSHKSDDADGTAEIHGIAVSTDGIAPGGPNFGLNVLFQSGTHGSLRDGTLVGRAVVEDHELSAKEEDALFSELDDEMAATAPSGNDIYPTTAIWRTLVPKSFSQTDADDIRAGRRYLYATAQVRYSDTSNPTPQVTELCRYFVANFEAQHFCHGHTDIKDAVPRK